MVVGWVEALEEVMAVAAMAVAMEAGMVEDGRRQWWWRR